MTIVLIFEEYTIKIRILVQKKMKRSPKKVYLCRQSRQEKKGPKQIKIIYWSLFENAQKYARQQGKLRQQKPVILQHNTYEKKEASQNLVG